MWSTKQVAPYAGAWIEMKCSVRISSTICVAPYAGAWIEIAHQIGRVEAWLVAPYAGAWIEICVAEPGPVGYESPLTQGRGLKFSYLEYLIAEFSRPLRRGVD